MTQGYDVTVLVIDRVSVESSDFKTLCNLTFPVSKERQGQLIVYYGVYPTNCNLSAKDRINIYLFHGEKLIRRVLQEQRDKPFVFIHAQCTYPAGILAYSWSLLTGCRYMITEHFGPFNPDFLHSKYAKELIINSLEKASIVLSVSKHLRQQLLMNGIKCDPLVVGNLVDDQLFCLCNSGIHTPLRLLTVAYYPGYIKDIENLLGALSILKELGFQFHSTIIGGGEPRGGNKGENIMVGLIQRYHLDDSITLIGSCNRVEMKDYMEQCDVYVSPSILETFGVCICEAMLCGKPVVITDNGGSSEYADENNSIVVNIHDSRDLAEGIVKVSRDYSSFNPHCIRDSIMRKYGRSVFYERLSTFYDRLIDISS